MTHNHRKKRRAPQPRDDVDLILRHVSRQFPAEVARALLRTDKPIEPLEWVDTQVTSRQRRLDRALAVKVGGQRILLHAEWLLRMTQHVPLRVFEYNTLTALTVAAEARAKRQGPPPRIESVAVVLTGRKKPWPSHHEYCTSPPAEPFSGVHFRIEPVYQQTVAELEAKGAFWSVFTPLATDADEKKLAQVLARLRAATAPKEFEELAVAMAVVAGADRRKRGLADVVKSLLPRKLVMESWIFKEGLTEGRVESFESFAHLFERRLSRRLTAAERKRLKERLRAEGPMKVSDLILDLPAAELSAWLAPPNGHRR